MAYKTVLSSKRQPPRVAQLRQAMEVAAGTLPGANYLVKQVTYIVNNLKELKSKPELREKLISVAKEFEAFIRMKFDKFEQQWRGEQVAPTVNENVQKAEARTTMTALAGELNNVKVDYAVSSDGHYVRGYSIDRKELPKASQDALDLVFYNWLATKGYQYDKGYIYPSETQGRTPQDRVSASELESLLADKGSTGLDQYMQKQGATNLAREQHDYPSDEKEAELKQEIESAVSEAEHSVTSRL